MPELGETWSVVEAQGDRERLEAVVVATGPSMIRLVTRSGRRMTFPSSRWDATWSLVHPGPAAPERCTHCRQTAFFRHNVSSATFWVCEDHVPHGATAYFPGDTPGPPGHGLICPQCESTRVEVESRLTQLSGSRTALRVTCWECSRSWSTLVSRGLADDGAFLAEDLARVISDTPSISEIWLGFVAHRNLCRAMGVGNVDHFQGVPLEMNASFPDTLAVVFFTTGQAPSPEATQAPLFGSQFPSRAVPFNSVWRRRSLTSASSSLCRVVSPVNEHHVTFRFMSCEEISNPSPAKTLPVSTFHLYWKQNVLQTDAPSTWTVWRHRDTGQLVQVTPNSATHNANGQVSYVTPEMLTETTPITTFHRLYRELPTPPDDHVWFRDGELYTAATRGDQIVVTPYVVHEALDSSPSAEHSSLFSPAAFYARHRPVIFEDELFVNRPSTAILRRDAHWQRVADTAVSAFIVDIGQVEGGIGYVRFNNRDGSHIMEQRRFLEEFQTAPRPIPCAVGETWVGIQPQTPEVLVEEVDSLRGNIVLRLESGIQTTLSVEQFAQQYRKLDIRSYWEILDSQDEP